MRRIFSLILATLLFLGSTYITLPTYAAESGSGMNKGYITASAPAATSAPELTAVSASPPTGNATTEAEAYALLMQLKTAYPDGKYWNNSGVTTTPCNHNSSTKTCNTYTGLTTYVFSHNPNRQCYGFASMLSDAVFGVDAPITVHKDFSKLKVGDNIRLTSYMHSFIVLSKTDTAITVAECNNDFKTCIISWGRKITKSKLESYERVYISRYPDAKSDDTAAVMQAREKVTLRSGTDYSSSAVTTCSSGTRLIVLNSTGMWYYVQTIGGKKGYVPYMSLKTVCAKTELKTSVPNVIGYAKVEISDTLNIRTGPAAGYLCLGSVPDNGTVEVLQKTSSSWYLIRYNGIVGYVSAGYLKSYVSAFKITASNDPATGAITLKWNAVDGAAKYDIYRSSSVNGKYTKLSSRTETTYTNVSVTPGKKYYYKVKAVTADGCESKFSNVAARTRDLARPVVTASNDPATGAITLKWKAIDGAVEYEIYRSSSENGKYTKLSSRTGTTYTNVSVTPGKKYYYKVKAICSNSAANSADSIPAARTRDLARPVVTASSNPANGAITLNWKAIDGAVEYEIYRSSSENGKYTKLSSRTGTTYTNVSVTPGKKYYYKVKAIHTNSAANSAFSPVVSITSK